MTTTATRPRMSPETTRVFVMVRAVQTVPNVGEYLTADYEPQCKCGSFDGEYHTDSGAALQRCGLLDDAYYPTVKGAALLEAALAGGYIDKTGLMTDAGRASIGRGRDDGAAC